MARLNGVSAIGEDAGEARLSTAPTGGAQQWGRGCHPFFSKLFGPSACAGLALLAAPAAALEAPVTLPSGLVAEFHEFRIEVQSPGEALARFRFVAPDFAGAPEDVEALAVDMDFLCADVALPAIPEAFPDPRRIVISVASARAPFGEARPDIMQVFEAYRVEDGRCIWEAF